MLRPDRRFFLRSACGATPVSMTATVTPSPDVIFKALVISRATKCHWSARIRSPFHGWGAEAKTIVAAATEVEGLASARLSGFGFEGHAGLGEEAGDEVGLALAGA